MAKSSESGSGKSEAKEKGGAAKLTLSKETVKDLQMLLHKVAAAQSKDVCVA